MKVLRHLLSNGEMTLSGGAHWGGFAALQLEPNTEWGIFLISGSGQSRTERSSRVAEAEQKPGMLLLEELEGLRTELASTKTQLAEEREKHSRAEEALRAGEQSYAELLRREQMARAETEAALKRLAQSEQRYRYMGETIPFGVWWCNPKGEAEYVSPSFCELLNMTLEEQRKFGWTKRLVPEDREPMLQKWLHCCATGTPWDHEHRIVDRYGKIHTVLSRGLPVRDDHGQIIAWVGVNLDITARKQVELQLQEAKEAAETANKAKDQLFATISHELRTPLALILGPVQKRLATGNLSDQERRDLEIVERNARTLLKHVNDLLDISKLQVGKMEASYAQVDLAWLVRIVASLFESIAAER
ncbi:MAG TPA: PAS domain-containing protein, partial [Clostridia bacterium]|nr:PAS domain-containing protein [Clostridia bacterium]